MVERTRRMRMTDLAEIGLDESRYSERTPPHDMLAEQSAIGGMLL